MKNIFILLLLAVTVSCSKHEKLEEFDKLEDVTASSRDAEDIEHRGIYINSFEENILGIPEEEDYLFDWCEEHNFNEITLYTVSSILNDAGQTDLLRDFVKKAHIFHNLDVSFVAASENAINKIHIYNGTDPTAPQCPDGIATEREFWQVSGSYTYYKEHMLDRLAEIDPNFAPTWQQQLYISKFVDGEGVRSDNQVREKTLKYLEMGGGNDQLFWVNYRANAHNFPNPDTAPVSYGRIQEIANTAHDLGFVVNFIVLFKTHTPTMEIYLETHDFYEAFESYKAGFEASDIEHKENINMEGYHFYRYSNAIEIKPL